MADAPRRPSSSQLAAVGAPLDLDALADKIAQTASDVLSEQLPLPADRCAAIAREIARRALLPLTTPRLPRR
jgi:hypothetical protein